MNQSIPPTVDDFAPVTITGKTGMDHLTELAGRLLDKRERKDQLNTELKDVNAQISEIERAMCETMLAGEYGKFTVWGKTFFMSTKRRVSTIPELRDELIQHLDDAGHGTLAARTINAMSFGKYVRELIDENGGAMPDDLDKFVNVFEDTTISVRKD